MLLDVSSGSIYVSIPFGSATGWHFINHGTNPQNGCRNLCFEGSEDQPGPSRGAWTGPC